MSPMTPQMSPVFPKISPAHARALPLDEISRLLRLKPGINPLENALVLKHGTLAKSQREYPPKLQRESPRGLSAKVYQAILRRIASEFTTGEQMRSWMQKYWPPDLLKRDGENLEILYEEITLRNRIPQIGAFPADYIKRNEQNKILDLLLNNKGTQVVWLTGLGGCGKTTLAVGLIKQEWALLKQHFAEVFWIDAEQADYQDGLLQLARQLDMTGQPGNVVEQKLKALTRTRKTLFLLDSLHEVKDWEQWKSLIGYLGRMIVTSRIRLSASQLSADSGLHQIEISGLSKIQTQHFFDNDTETIHQIFAYTEGLPLALRLLKGLMQDLHIPARQIASELSAHLLDVIASPVEEPKRNTSLHACFDLSWKVLEGKSRQAVHFFSAIGAFYSHTVPLEMVERVAAPEQSAQSREAEAYLQRYSLVSFQSQQEMVFMRVHALLHEFAREKLEKCPNAEQIRNRYHAQLHDSIQQWGQIFVQTGKLNSAIEFLQPDIEQAARSLAHHSPSDVTVTGQHLFNLLSAIGKQYLLKDWLAMLCTQKADSFAAAWAHNLRGYNALEQVNLQTAFQEFNQAYQLLGGNSIRIDAKLPYSEERIWNEKASSVLGMAETLLNDGKLQDANHLLSSSSSLMLFSLIASPFVRFESDYLKIAIAIEIAKQNPEKTQSDIQIAIMDLEMLRAEPPAKTNFVLKTKVSLLRAECFRILGKFRHAIRLYACLFHHPLTAPVARCEAGLDWVASLEETGQCAKAEAALREVETVLVSESKFLARFWKYMALVHYMLERYEQALFDASASLRAFRQIPASKKEQDNLLSLIAECREKLHN